MASGVDQQCGCDQREKADVAECVPKVAIVWVAGKGVREIEIRSRAGRPAVDAWNNKRQQAVIRQRDIVRWRVQRQDARASTNQREHRPPDHCRAADARRDRETEIDASSSFAEIQDVEHGGGYRIDGTLWMATAVLYILYLGKGRTRV